MNTAAGEGRLLSRRSTLVGLGAVIGGAVGSTATYAATPESSGPPAGATTPGEELMAEHGVLKRVLLIYRELSRRAHGHEPVPAGVLHGGASIIHHFIEGFHEALEETYVFPALVRANLERPTVEVLLAQHAAGRRITQDLLALVSSGALPDSDRGRVAVRLDAFVRMYEPHEAREDTVVFPAYRSITTDAHLAEMAERFADLQIQQFGGDGFAEVVAHVSALEQDLGIADLAQFTPTIT